MPEGWSGSGPRGRNCQSAPGRLRASSRPALRPVREVLAALAPGRVLPFAPGNSRKRGPELSQGVKALASAAVERRKASAPRKQMSAQTAYTCLRGALPRPAHIQAVTFGCVARTLLGCASRRSAPLGFIRGGKTCLVVRKPRTPLRRENEFLFRHCEERSDEAIQSLVAQKTGLLRFARNDKGAERAARTDFYFHLSPAGRGRAEGAGEGDQTVQTCEVSSPSPASHLRCSAPSPHRTRVFPSSAV